MGESPARAKQTTEHWRNVREFMEKVDQEIHETPTLPSRETLILRARLILEEAVETIHAMGLGIHVGAEKTWLYDNVVFSVMPDQNPILSEIADGCADLSVVTIGTLISCGIEDEELLRAVDQNNIRKFRHLCPKCGHEYKGTAVDDAAIAFKLKEGKIAAPGMLKCVTCGTEWRSGYRREDGKWVKPEGHKPPDIKAILLAQGVKDVADVSQTGL
ncbi:MAG: nucleoside triphosphate pyrophosphohydrolase family protein [Candidatus Thermoplasmatota archaeon]|nr:nucleoside triphosphate pyrophosphohydrolase family protein [Candidatus Thermoplasmatota archaeon]